MAAAKRWKFQPFYKDGHAVVVKTKLPFEFGIAGDKASPVAQNRGTFAVPSTDTAAAEITKDLTGVVPGQITHRVSPRYPEAAAMGRIQGKVELTAVIGKDGRVYEIHVVSGHPMLVPPAVSAVKEWRFEPYMQGGEPVAVETRIVVTFTQSQDRTDVAIRYTVP